MKIKILGAHNVESKNTRMPSILIDKTLAIDAGNLTSDLTFKEQEKIKAIFLSHKHFDHVRDIPSFAFNNPHKTTDIFGTKPTLKMLCSHLIDGEIYPDFTKKDPIFNNKTLNLIEIKPFDKIKYEGYKIKIFPIKHTIGSIGFEIFSKHKKSLFYSGDTGPGLTDIWKNISPDLLILETTLPNKMHDMAKKSNHLTPNILEKELLSFKKINKFFPKVILIHISPRYEKEIQKEIEKIEKKLKISIDFPFKGKEIII